MMWLHDVVADVYGQIFNLSRMMCLHDVVERLVARLSACRNKRESFESYYDCYVFYNFYYYYHYYFHSYNYYYY